MWSENISAPPAEAPREPLLFLAHRIPYPPDKGDKIRSFHLLKHLSTRYRVHLGAFVDTPGDAQHRSLLESACASVHLPKLGALRARARSTAGLLTRDALTLAYYRDAGMRGWVDGVIARERIAKAVVFCSSVAQYVAGPRYASLKRIIDFVDVDSDKWRQYSEGTAWPKSWVYGREARCLLRYEARIAAEFDRSFFTTADEAAHFRSLAPAAAAKVGHFCNGVDLDYFNGLDSFATPYAPATPVVVFTGAMDYWANVDAVTWFASAILPAIRERVRGAKFVIVGSNPAPRVAALASDDVIVTGRVPDVRPYLCHARVAVAPMRVARGVQNKILEALAMGCPVVATSKAAAGIASKGDGHVAVADEPSLYADAVARLLAQPRNRAAGDAGRRFVTANYDWTKNLAAITDSLSRA